MEATATLLDCGHPPTPQPAGSICTGYARFDVGTAAARTVCYDCANVIQERQLRETKHGQRFTGYLSCDGKSWTTWTGHLLGRVVLTGARHPWSRTRNYLTVRGIDNRWWYGTGGKGEWATLRASDRSALD